VTRRGAAVLGSPIAHSLSPALHRAAYRELGLSGWDYTARECTEDRLLATLRELAAAGLAGVSLTMPLKRAVLPLLARVDRPAADVGAVNTVLFGGVAEDWWGTNTDVPGMVAALRSGGVPELARTGPPWVLGAGATAASALAAVAELGAGEVVVAARNPVRAEALAGVAARFGLRLSVRSWPVGAAELADAPVVVSTVPAGSTDRLATTVTPAARSGLLFDVVYAPWPTRLASAWGASGGRVLGGLELLVQQAAEQVHLMTGRSAPVDAMRAAGGALLGVDARGGIH